MEVEAAVGETPSLTGEFVAETQKVLNIHKTHPPRNQHQKGPICLWVAGELTESWLRDQQVALFSLGPLPHIQSYNPAKWVDISWRLPKAPSFTT